VRADLVHHSCAIVADVDSLDQRADDRLAGFPVAFAQTKPHSFSERLQLPDQETQFRLTRRLLSECSRVGLQALHPRLRRRHAVLEVLAVQKAVFVHLSQARDSTLHTRDLAVQRFLVVVVRTGLLFQATTVLGVDPLRL
jgi:hypothetical protein